MSWLSRVANVFRSSEVNRALDEEITFHIDSRVDDLVAAGMTRKAAEAMARRQFGNPLRLRESSRDVKLMPWLEDLVRDLRHGLRALLTLFSALALLLAAIGTYGVLASMVAERRHELAIRLALGANRARLLRQVMTQGLRLAGAGAAVGLAGALGLNRLLTSLLFGVQPADVMTLAIAIPSILGLAALASWLPAWRASRLDPNVVLRVD
jgi:predicted lysophospholipase L1 biosynthesis ABC-type transport system permease subunit